MHDHAPFSPDRAQRLTDPLRLDTQLSEQDLARLLALRGDEDVVELGSGAGFYTDRIAALTTGTVYVRLVSGDVTGLELPAASLDVACSISTWHETDGVIDLTGLARALRPGGRLVIVDWRKEPDSAENGPPLDMRFNKEEAAASLTPHFRAASAEDLGRFMFAVVATRVDLPGE